MKIVFFGSSDFSIPCFEFLAASSRHELAAVVTTPDRPKGRGLGLQANPIKQRSEKKGVRVFEPEKLSGSEAQKEIQAMKPEVFVVASYGKLIPGSWLEIPSKAALNVHPSLLPKYRGAAPIAWQILNGDREVGVSIAEVTKELDAGDIFTQIRIPMDSLDTAESLTQKLSELGRKALEDVLTKLEQGTLQRTPQDSSQSNYARKLTKEDGHLKLSEPARELEWKIRAFHPWPGAFVDYQGKPLRIVEARCDSIACAEAEPGVLLALTPEGELRIQTGKGSLRISKVQLPGRRVITGREFANGERLKLGFTFKSLAQ